MLLAAAPASAAWSGASQVVGVGQATNVVASLDDDGTQQLGFLTPSVGLINMSRPAGSTGSAAWTSKNVSGAINNGRFAFATNGAAVATWRGAGETVWAAYRAAGKAWGSPAQIDNPAKLGEGPLPVISAKGAAAVVWSRKSAIGKREPDEIVYSATADGSWSPAPSLLASIAVPTPVNNEHFLSCLPGSALVAAMLPTGQPIAAWNDVYGSFKQKVTTPPGENELGICGVRAATPGSPVNVTPRPAFGPNVTPSGELPFWRPVSIGVDPVSGRTALVLRGSADSITTSCGPQEVDYCYDSSTGFETRVSLGTGTTIPYPGSLTASLAAVSLRNGFVAAASGSGTAALTGGVGTGFPTLTALNPNALLTVSSLAVGSKGEAELMVHENSKLTAYSAAAGGQFGAGVEIGSASATNVSVAVGCNGDGLLGWGRTGNLYAATNLTANPQCAGGGENPGPGPGPTDPGGGTPTDPGAGGGSGGSGGSAGSGQTTTPPTGPPAPAPLKPTALKCKKGFQKKTVGGKPKCVKKKTHKPKKKR